MFSRQQDRAERRANNNTRRVKAWYERQIGPKGHSYLINARKESLRIWPEGKTVKNRLHFDLRPEDTRDAEVVRLQALGATVYAQYDWTVMQDPEGNEFCVEKGPGDRKAQAAPSAQA